jgi:hypothetical protein
MRIIRFVDTEGQIQIGTPFSVGLATPLRGDLFGELDFNGRQSKDRKVFLPRSTLAR